MERLPGGMLFITGIFLALLNTAIGIMGGNETSIEKYSFALQMKYIDKLECGGVLITDRLALTAAHCIYKQTMENFEIRAGTTTLGEGGQTFTMSEVIFHPKYNWSDDAYDLAIVLLSEAVDLTNAKTAQLATDDSVITEGGIVMIAGWGWMRSNSNDEYSTTLRETDLTILSDETCQDYYKTEFNREVMFCAFYLDTKIRDFCFGDYGGPAVIDGVLQGIISFGEGCGDGIHPGVFVRIASVREWIEDIVNSYSN